MRFKNALLILISLVLLSFVVKPDWGFFGHRKINRMAVFTLPQDLLGFYKENLEYVTAHAVDPDKRRYALKNEFARHYIDIDHWDTIPFNNVPRDLMSAVMKFGKLKAIANLDTIQIEIPDSLKSHFYAKLLYLDRYSVQIPIESDSLNKYMDGFIAFNSNHEFFFDNTMVQYGILPYFLEDFYKRLVKAFYNKEIKNILKISADIGHYISDGHVPLHTTENYNGQLSNQIGIHAFWESRLPELFADETYDFLVGKAIYIEDVNSYIWDFITESHALLPDVLEIEQNLKTTYPEDQQFCFEERLEVTTRIQCEKYSAAYHDALDGMVEKRMQDAILAVGSMWYSAWVDAGQPELNNEVALEEETEEENLNKAYDAGNIYGRKHD